MFVWKIGRAKTFSLIVVTTDGEVGLHVGAERAEMGRLSRQEAMMAAQTAFPPDPHKWELFSNKFSSLSSQPFPRCWGTPASKIPICCQYHNQCQHPQQQNLNWLKYVSVRVYVLLLLFISKEWYFVRVMIFVGKVVFFLLEKFLKYTTQNFLPTKIFWRYVHFALKLPQGGKDFGNIFGAGQK